MRVLVTGAGGFVGEALCRRLAASGHQVTGLFRNTPSARRWMAVQAVGDLTRIDDFRPIVQDVDAVVHLAARVHMMRDTAIDLDAAYAAANTEVTRRLTSAAVEAGVESFVFLSSIKVNGEATAGKPFSERDVPSPEDPYGRSKLAAEIALQDLSAGAATRAVSLRVPLVYGPGVRANFAALMRLCDLPLPLPLDGISQNRRSLLYLGNLTHAIETVLAHQESPSGVYTLSDDEDLSTAALVKQLRRSLNRRMLPLPVPPSILYAAASILGKKAAADRLCGSLEVDPGTFRVAYDWRPPYSVDQGIAATVADYRATH